MKSPSPANKFFRQPLRGAFAFLCVASLLPDSAVVLGQATEEPVPATLAPEAAKISPDQLDSLVAPIALNPDPLLSQTLVASTYPLEIIQLQQWMDRNTTLKGKALAET